MTADVHTDPLASAATVPSLNREHAAVKMHHDADTEVIENGRRGAASIREIITDGINALATRPDVKGVAAAAKAVTAAVDAAYVRAASARNDPNLPPAGREQAVAEALAEAEAQIREGLEAGQAAVTVAKAKLTTQAVGKVSTQREAFARQDAELIMQAASNPVEALQRLARDDDPDIRALAAGQWGRRRLEAAGIDNPDRMHQTVVMFAVDHARTAGTPTQRKAAADLASIDHAAAKALDGASHYAAMSLEGFRR